MAKILGKEKIRELSNFWAQSTTISTIIWPNTEFKIFIVFR